jgi:hypothetical protein
MALRAAPAACGAASAAAAIGTGSIGRGFVEVLSRTKLGRNRDKTRACEVLAHLAHLAHMLETHRPPGGSQSARPADELLTPSACPIRAQHYASGQPAGGEKATAKGARGIRRFAAANL